MILTYYTPYATLATLQQREQSGACSSYVERRQCRHCQRCNVFVGILGGIRKKCYLCIWILKEAKKCLYINKVYEAYKNHGDAQL